jgi:hypothetical protein
LLLLFFHAAGSARQARKDDKQNQTQFFDSEFNSETYNFYERKKISQPLQPRYDTDNKLSKKVKSAKSSSRHFLRVSIITLLDQKINGRLG